MKDIYCFYLVKTHIDINEYIGVKADTINESDTHEYSLYAFTPDVNIASLFMKMRDMDIFYYKVIKIDKDEYEEFCSEHEDYLLEYHLFITKGITDGKYSVNNEYVLCTKSESESIIFYGESHLFNILDDDWYINKSYGIIELDFNKKLSKVLNKYFYYDDMINICKEITEEMYGYIDQLALFIRLFSNTLNKKWKK